MDTNKGKLDPSLAGGRGDPDPQMWNEKATRMTPAYRRHHIERVNSRDRQTTFLRANRRAIIIVSLVIFFVVVLTTVGIAVGVMTSSSAQESSGLPEATQPTTPLQRETTVQTTVKSRPTSARLTTTTILRETTTESGETSPSPSTSQELTTQQITTERVTIMPTSPTQRETTQATTIIETTTGMGTTGSTTGETTGSTSADITSQPTTTKEMTTLQSSETTKSVSSSSTTPGSAVVTMDDVTIYQGEEDIFLVCRASGDKSFTQFTFFKDAKEITDGITQKNIDATLVIKGSTCLDAGIYTCQATGDFSGVAVTTASVTVFVRSGAPSLRVSKDKVDKNLLFANISCERIRGLPPATRSWRVLFATGQISENYLFGSQVVVDNTNDQCSVMETTMVSESFDKTWEDAEVCCVITDSQGKLQESCDILTFSTSNTGQPGCTCTEETSFIPTETTFPENCELYYRCDKGVRVEESCKGQGFFSADTTLSVCTIKDEEAYCAKVKADMAPDCSLNRR